MNNINPADIDDTKEQIMENRRYCITTLKDSDNGLRVMKYPHNSLGTHKTEREARDHLIGIVTANSEESCVRYLGDLSKIEIRAVDCHPTGDPKQTVFS